ncbi:MAG: hypothetical protein U0165_14750 [Polyangiaceae bacterium]
MTAFTTRTEMARFSIFVAVATMSTACLSRSPGPLNHPTVTSENAESSSQSAVEVDTSQRIEAPLASANVAKSPDDKSASNDTSNALVMSIERPANVACVVMPEDTLKVLHEGFPLRIRADLPPFATVINTAHGPLIVGKGKPATAVYELSTRGVFVRGVVTPADIPLHPRREIEFEGMLTAGANVKLAWSTATTGSINVSWPLPGGFSFQGKSTLERAVGCGDLSTERVEYVVERHRGNSPLLILEASHPLELAREPGASPIAQIFATNESRIFEQLDAQGDFIKVGHMFGTEEAYLAGWTPRSNLTVMHGGRGFGRSGCHGLGVADRFSAKTKQIAVCNKDISFDAVVAKHRATVGRAIAGSCIELQETTAGRTSIGLIKAPFMLRNEGMLDIDEHAVDGCTTYKRADFKRPSDLPVQCR